MAIEVIDAERPVFTVAIDGFIVQTTVTSRGDEVEEWIDEILRIHHRRLHRLVVGLDVEWRAYTQNRVAVLQICVGRRCLVFQVRRADFFPENLVAFLGDHRFTFVGVGIQSDADRLAEDWDLNVADTVDLCTLAANRMQREDLRNVGLMRLAREVMGVVVEKLQRVTFSNWENSTLSYEQIGYACADAFLSFEIGKRLLAGQF